VGGREASHTPGGEVGHRVGGLVRRPTDLRRTDTSDVKTCLTQISY